MNLRVNSVPAGRKTNATAILALISAILGFTCLWGIGGLAAVILGVVALRKIERSAGGESGSGLSVAAIALGGIQLAALVLFATVAITLHLRPVAAGSPKVGTSAPLAHTTPTAKPTPSAAPETTRQPSTSILGARETQFGRVRLVDIDASGGSVLTSLEAEWRAANLAGEKLIVFVVADDCLPCNGVCLALTDRRMQRALDRVRLVRIDHFEHASELTQLGIPIDSVPGFALLGATLRPVDYVHGGEWDADVAENIAPVLKAFVRGTYLQRRHPFRRKEQPGEIPL